MRLFYWFLSIASIGGVWYSDKIHLFLQMNVTFYSLQKENLIQVLLAVLAGIFATKASDSSRELKELMKISEIEGLIIKADKASGEAMKQYEKYNNISELVKRETEKQFARAMLISHRYQLIHHWREIESMEAILTEPTVSDSLDPEIKKHIKNYILRSKYVDYIGRNFLQNIPLFGGILNFMFGPIWEEFYIRLTYKLSKRTPKNSDNGSEQTPNY